MRVVASDARASQISQQDARLRSGLGRQAGAEICTRPFSKAVLLLTGAHRTWFHLYRLVLERPPEAHTEEEMQQQTQQVAAAVEQFLQTSTVGEYEQRLNMVWSFRYVCVYMQQTFDAFVTSLSVSAFGVIC